MRLELHLGTTHGGLGIRTAPVPAGRAFHEGFELAFEDVKLAEKLAAIANIQRTGRDGAGKDAAGLQRDRAVADEVPSGLASNDEGAAAHFLKKGGLGTLGDEQLITHDGISDEAGDIDGA